MKPGPKPQPTKLKLLRGNPGKRPLNENEADAGDKMPKPPKHLSPAALKQWKIVAPQLNEIGLLAKLDGPAMEMYCVAYGNWADAQEKIQKYGPLVKARSGFLQQSPYMQIANKAFEQMHKMIGEFGMSPSSRSGIAVEKDPQDKPDGFQVFRR